MKLKALMMSAATAALLAGAATAEQHEADGEMENAAETAAEEAGDAAQAAGEAAEQAGEEVAQETQEAAEEAEQAAESAAESAENAAEEASAEASEEMNEAEAEMEAEADMDGEGEPTSIAEMTVGDVTGMNVFGPENERIGEIDYVIDRGDGAEAVIGIGGFLGLGEYTVALPMSEFELQQDPEGFVVDTDRETLEQQPEIDESELEELPDDTMMSDLMGGGGVDGAASDMESGDASAEADAEAGSDDMSTSGDAEMETESEDEDTSGN